MGESRTKQHPQIEQGENTPVVHPPTKWPWELKENRLSSLTQVTQYLATDIQRDAALEKVIEAALSLLKARRGFIMLIDPKDSSMTIQCSKGMPPSVTSQVSLKAGEGISGFVAQKGRPLLVDNLQTYRGFRKTPASRYESEAFFSIPIVSAPLNIFGQTLGVMNISDTQNGGSFTTEELALLSVLASEAAMIVACWQAASGKQEKPISNVADLQSALTAISGHAQYLMLNIPKECKAAEVLKKIVQETNRAFSVLKTWQK